MAQYGKSEYWDERYTRDPEPFDWYQRWSGVRDIVVEHVKAKAANILMVGCGNSRMGEEMYEDGYTQIMNVDISMVCIKAMQEKYRDKVGMQFQQMDMRAMEFPEGAYNIVVDKGTLDIVLCGEGSTLNVQKALAEISRVLDSKGVYVCISHGQPSYRLTYLQRPEFGWDVKVHTVTKPMMGQQGAVATKEDKDNVHYVYVCVKGGGETQQN